MEKQPRGKLLLQERRRPGCFLGRDKELLMLEVKKLQVKMAPFC